MIPYKPFAQQLKDNNVIATPAELHGHASGMLVVNHDMEVSHWIKLILEDYCFEGSNQSKLIPVLTALFDFAKDKLTADNYTFNLLLPADDNELSYRLEALSTWCSIFLTGMAYAGLKSDKNMHNDAHEFILDLEKIAKVDTMSGDSQGEEADFVELVEYVKAGTILLYQEFVQS
ncbi:hypothetical protein MNBD_GAMMA01-745 [hydrothermal vent metagenome]|uniref:YecA family protein n=1 Tax=hydrothermal vent metagenome TaxID=652676 RepID=A0A3B0USN0_9ZZZZ